VHGVRAAITRVTTGGRAGRPPFGRGMVAARVLARTIDAAAAIGSRLPGGLAHRMAVMGGNLEWALRPGVRRVLATNLAHAVDGDADDRRVRRLVRRELVNEARRSADLLWAIGRPGDFLRAVVIEGREHVERAAERGRGVVLVGIHLGGWEVATPVPREVVPVPTTVITADDWLAWGIDHVRRAAGLRPVRAGESLELLRVLRRGECLLMLGDDAVDDHAHTLPVELLGARARLPAGPVVLARFARAPIVTFDVLPIGPRRWRVTIGAPIEPPATAAEEARVLQQLAERWTASIRAHPEHWSARFPIAWEPSA
jgi:lauroyl/myristoyl acyltransferase